MELIKDFKITMSTVEISDLTGKRHDHVMRDFRVQCEQLKIGDAQFGGSYLSSQNKEIACYNLDEEQTKVLIMGYSAPMRLAVIRRLDELEGNAVTKQPTMIDYAHALIDAHKTIE